jgi:hypothetical protein
VKERDDVTGDDPVTGGGFVPVVVPVPVPAVPPALVPELEDESLLPPESHPVTAKAVVNAIKIAPAARRLRYSMLFSSLISKRFLWSTLSMLLETA